MTHDTLAIIWFGLWGLIWAIYFILDGYTTGTGMLFPFITKNEKEQKQLQESVGPFWGANEVWLITAGGATFAAFPKTYALMFSYLYIPMYLILFALFFRAIGLEFMHKHDNPLWKKTWKWSFFTGSALIPLLFGVAFANLFYGLNFDDQGSHITFFGLLNGYGLLGGVTFITMFILSGSLWINLKTSGPIHTRASRLVIPIWLFASVSFAMFLVATAMKTTLLANFSATPILWIVPALALITMLLTGLFASMKRYGLAFTSISMSILTFMATGFIGLFPNMLPSKINDAFSVTLFDAAGSELNLQIMFFVAVAIVPIVIAYQIWMYRIFAKKISPDQPKGYQ